MKREIEAEAVKAAGQKGHSKAMGRQRGGRYGPRTSNARDLLAETETGKAKKT